MGTADFLHDLLFNGGVSLSGSDTIPSMTTETNNVGVPNINQAERGKRLRSGLIILAVGLVILIMLVYFDVSLWWRLILFPFFAAGMSGIFQWRDKT